MSARTTEILEAVAFLLVGALMVARWVWLQRRHRRHMRVLNSWLDKPLAPETLAALVGDVRTAAAVAEAFGEQLATKQRKIYPRPRTEVFYPVDAVRKRIEQARD